MHRCEQCTTNGNASRRATALTMDPPVDRPSVTVCSLWEETLSEVRASISEWIGNHLPDRAFRTSQPLFVLLLSVDNSLALLSHTVYFGFTFFFFATVCNDTGVDLNSLYMCVIYSIVLFYCCRCALLCCALLDSIGLHPNLLYTLLI